MLIRLETTDGPLWIDPDLISCIDSEDDIVVVYLNVNHGRYRFYMPGITVDETRELIRILVEKEAQDEEAV